MTWAATAIAAVSAVVSAVGVISSADASRRAANQNADIAEQNAIAARQKAAYDEQMHRERVKKILGSQRALYGKAGVEMTGSPLLVMEDTAEQGELDALAIRFGGEVSASQNRSQANLMRMQGRDAMTAGTFTAGATLLQGAGNAYGNYNRMTGKISSQPYVIKPGG